MAALLVSHMGGKKLYILLSIHVVLGTQIGDFQVGIFGSFLDNIDLSDRTEPGFASLSCLAGPPLSVVSIPLDTPKPLIDQGSPNNLNPNFQTAQFVSDCSPLLKANTPQSESNLPLNIHPLTLQSHPQGMSLCTTAHS